MATTAIQVTLAERTVADLYNMIAGVREAAVAKHPRGAGGNYRLVAVSADRVLSHEFGCEPLFLIDACPSKKQIVGYAKDMAERFPEVDEFVIDLDADIYSREMGRDDKGAFIELEQTGEGFDCTVAAVTRGPAPTTPPPAPKTPKVAKASVSDVPHGLSDGGLELFTDLAEDAGNWSGQPLFGGNVGCDPSDRGWLTELKKKGLVTTFADDEDSSLSWVVFTDAGRALADKLGTTLEDYR